MPHVIETTRPILGEFTGETMDRFYRKVLHTTPLGNMYEVVMGEVEAALLETTLKHAKGDIAVAASILGVPRTALLKRLHKYRIVF